jgi:predicted DNA-binding transcriptional regulator YafY
VVRRKKKPARPKEGSHIDRVFRLARLLSTRKSGVTILSLVEELDVSRASIYRDLKVLERAGFPIASSKVNGEARYAFSSHHAPLPRNRDETLALVLAKIALAPIAGTSVYRALSAIANGSRDDGRVVLTVIPTPARGRVRHW